MLFRYALTSKTAYSGRVCFAIYLPIRKKYGSVRSSIAYYSNVTGDTAGC